MNADWKIMIKTESGCEQLLFELCFSNGTFICTCGHTKYYRIKGRRNVYQCAACNKQLSITAGTFFHKKRHKLVTCFAALVAVLEGKNITESEHREALGLKESTAWRWYQQIRLFLLMFIPDDETITVDRELLQKVLFRRSVETPAKDTQIDRSFSETLLEARSEIENRSASETIEFVASRYRGVSEKYSQLYAAEHHYHKNAKRISTESLLSAIMRAGPLGVNDVVAYSSPRLIRLPRSRLTA
jgi:transposase-like protein